MNWLERRVEKLESAAGIGDEFLPRAQLLLQPGDSEAAAMADYRAKHPELDGKEIAWIVIQIVECKEGRRCQT